MKTLNKAVARYNGISHVADGSPRFAYQKLAPTQPLG